MLCDGLRCRTTITITTTVTTITVMGINAANGIQTALHVSKYFLISAFSALLSWIIVAPLSISTMVGIGAYKTTSGA